MLALSGVASAILATQGTGFASLGLPAEIALLLALAIDALAGVINGLAVTQLRVAPIIAHARQHDVHPGHSVYMDKWHPDI